MHLPRHRERPEHRLGDVGRAPIPSRERRRHPLARAEAVEDRASGEAAVAQVDVDGAAEVGPQMRAGCARGFVDGEVRRPGERGRHAAQPDAARAVRAQLNHGPPR